MRVVSMLVVLLCWLPAVSYGQINFAPTLEEALILGEGFEGDHVIVLTDSTAAYLDFVSGMLDDPEVSEYVNGNFGAYRTDSGSKEADAVRLKYFSRGNGPLIILSSPRLDNLTIFIGPTCAGFTKDILMRDLKAVRQAITLEEFYEALK